MSIEYFPTVLDVGIRDLMSVPAQVGARIKSLRETQGLTQVQLSDACGISQPALSAIERGDTKRPEAETILKIAAVLKTTPQFLIWDHQLPDVIPATTQAIVDCWNSLDEAQRAQVVAYARGLIDARPAQARPVKRPPPGAH